MEPLLRWAGSKRRSAEFICGQIEKTSWNGKYIEPFGGAAAVLFKLEPKQAILSDICKPLISFYKTVQEEPEGLVEELERLTQLPHLQTTYYSIRSEWNYNDIGPRAAARLLYLNRTGFNGLFRLNSKLEYNVPWGNKPSAPKFPTAATILAASELLKRTVLYTGDYKDILKKARKGAAVYCDPPYLNTYDKYAGDSFNYDNHCELANRLKKLADKGVNVFVSNIDCNDTRSMYSWANCLTVPVRHNIAASANSRNTVSEILVVGKKNEQSA